jgi:Flp pilus assembly protein TadB
VDTPEPEDAEPSSSQSSSSSSSEPGSGTAHLARSLAIYTLLRLALVVALTAVLALVMPLIVAALFAIIVQLPLSWLLFSGPRARVNDAIAQASSRRRAERARLQSALSGESTE